MRTLIFGSLALLACGAEAQPPAATPDPSSVSSAVAAAASTDAAASASAAAPAGPALPAVELVQGDAAPAPAKMPRIDLVTPAKNQVVPSAKAKALALDLHIRDWDLGPAGDLCAMIDQHPCVPVADAKHFPTLGQLDPTLDDGQHVITVFARRPSLESIKPQGKTAAFASQSFFVGKKSASTWKDGSPMILASAPLDAPAPPEGVLLDFYLANGDGARKVKVHVSVGGPGIEQGVGAVADRLAPYRLKNARPGDYLVRYTLHSTDALLGPSGTTTTVEYQSKPMTGPFTEVTRSFRVLPPR